MDDQHEENQSDKTALRYLLYWSAGIAISLTVTVVFEGPLPELIIPLSIACGVTLVSGFAYLRRTTRSERRHDLADRQCFL